MTSSQNATFRLPEPKFRFGYPTTGDTRHNPIQESQLPEVMTPLRHTMRLVDDQIRQHAALHKRLGKCLESGCGCLFRGHVEQFGFGLFLVEVCYDAISLLNIGIQYIFSFIYMYRKFLLEMQYLRVNKDKFIIEYSQHVYIPTSVFSATSLQREQKANHIKQIVHMTDIDKSHTKRSIP